MEEEKKKRSFIPEGYINNATSVGALIVVVLIVVAARFMTTPDSVQQSAWSLLPAVIAISLALITKEVYSSLFAGILTGALLYTGYAFEGTINHVFQAIVGYTDENDAFVSGVLTDSYNMGILIFLVVLGAMVAVMNKAGGSAAFGKWASEHIKSKAGAELATILLGCLIFVDDYFNCLTVGSVMRPVTDKFHVSRAKLAYLIDATAAPVCIIAPISSWAAAVSGFVEGENGLALFIKAIPYNFYALFTIAMMVLLVVMKIDYGPMAVNEANAENGDLYTVKDESLKVEEPAPDAKGTVLDLVLPVLALVICCVVGMIWTGGFFGEGGGNFIEAFSNSDASVGLAVGSFFGLMITLVLYLVRRVLTFESFMACIPEGFKAMVPAIMVLTFAWTLKAMTDSLGAKDFVAGIIQNNAAGFAFALPAIIFLIGCGLAFATGTSWGTFGILIPIVVSAFQDSDPQLMLIAISACMAGAVCGDHCSPISDTTIMASAGAVCNHVNHVSTQLPYALTVAGVSAVTYIVAGISKNFVIAIPFGIVILVITMLALKRTEVLSPRRRASR
ncbi:MAG: Na+/H+ antiporter NhaC family protein [Eubacterium sp.]|nr:Na+/H+ antiporter NhaC family protein [Eubacterium sp.]